MIDDAAGTIRNHAAILRCPVSHESVRAMNSVEFEAFCSRIQRGDLHHLDGTPVEAKLQEALISSSGDFAYAVQDGIAILLREKAILLQAPGQPQPHIAAAAAKKSIQDFYDQAGWKKGDNDVFVDTERYEDLRPVSSKYIHKCHQRVGRRLQPPAGVYFLDAGSGPIPHDDYLDYSRAFDYRICVDLSFLALQQARVKLGERGVYLLADLTNLPLNNDIAGAIVSLHAIYHIPADEQRSAFLEIGRVLKPGSTAVVVYSWGDHAPVMNSVLFPLKLLRYFPSSVKKMIKRQAAERLEVEVRDPGDAPLYAHYHSYRWFKEQAWNFQYAIRVWRSVNLPFLKYYVHGRLFGRPLLDFIYWMEERFPEFFGRFGQYPMIIISKSTLPSERH